MGKINWPLICLAYLTLLALALIDNTRGPVYPNIIEELNISSSRASMLFAIASFSGLLTNITARWWLPYIGSQSIALLSLFFLGSGSLLFSQSTTYGLWLLDTSSFVIGLGLGTSNIGINLLVAQATPIIHRRRFFAGLHSIYGIGSFAAPLLLNFYLLFFTDWNIFFILLAIIPLFVITIFLLLNKNKRAPSHSSGPKRLSPPCNFQTRFIFGLLFGLYVSSEIIISSRLVYFLSFYDSISLAHARYALSAFFLGLLAGRLSFTFIKTSIEGEKLLLISIFSTLGLYILSISINPFFLALTGLTMSYFFPVAMEWLSKIFEEGFEFMVASVMTGISIMLVLMHLGFGVVTDILGIHMAMAIYPVFQVLCFLMILIIRKKYLRA